MTLQLTEKATKYLSLLREDRIEEALEYALELLKKEAIGGSAAKYFYKATSSKNSIVIHTTPQVIETKKIVVEEVKEAPSNFSTLKSQVYEKKEEIEEEKEIKVVSPLKGFVDLTEL